MNEMQPAERGPAQVGKDPIMLFFAIFLVVYLLLQLVVLPKLGIPT